MPEKFVVPQFIENEDKILGPITVRQFLICLAAVFAIFIQYTIFQMPYSIFFIIPTITLAGVFSFLKINGHAFHIFFINFLQTRTRPALRVWHKELTRSELKAFIQKAPELAILTSVGKSRPESTRLRDLALTVNTGGVYNSEADDSL